MIAWLRAEGVEALIADIHERNAPSMSLALARRARKRRSIRATCADAAE